jgi:putative Holliday junction resolvase
MARILGVDYGEQRVGIAVSDPLGMLATAKETLHVRGRGDAVARVAAAAGENEAERIVVGLPLRMDGTGSRITEEVQAFVKDLAAAATVPVDVWDERLSTRLVDRAMLEADLSRKKRKRLRDKLAAQVILQGYLDAHGAAEP